MLQELICCESSCGCCDNLDYFPKLDYDVSCCIRILNYFPLTAGFGTMISACYAKEDNQCTIVMIGLV